MKRESWLRLECMLERHGFLRDESRVEDAATKWFIRSSPDEDVTACLRFVFKPKMHVLTAHLGWSHKAVREFCLTALQSNWPQGFAWLKEAGVVDAPCLSLFNLADYMAWKLGGMSVGGDPAVYESAEIRLGEALEGTHWWQQDAQRLLAHYVNDQAPFDWRASNSAIRLAEIAGLSKVLGAGLAHFDRCASDHQALIETDMFGLGSASVWIASLRARLATSGGA